MDASALGRAARSGPVACDPAPRGQMEDAGGGEGVSAERFAALMSHAKLPEPLAADAQELLQALTPCVAAYDASEEAQQPLVRAAAARRCSGFGARDALPALTRRVPLGAPRRARVARAH